MHQFAVLLELSLECFELGLSIMIMERCFDRSHAVGQVVELDYIAHPRGKDSVFGEWLGHRLTPYIEKLTFYQVFSKAPRSRPAIPIETIEPLECFEYLFHDRFPLLLDELRFGPLIEGFAIYSTIRVDE
mmetsp:Transcript_27230/g.36392  ORF Transcript_27230/g.36392 Transcript_27230/m.36392 type:complete len:130 (-) Transcript_27230:1009-1398(-)